MKNLLKILLVVFGAALVWSTAKLVFISSSLDDNGTNIKNILFFYIFGSLISSLLLMIIIRLLITNESNQYNNEIERLNKKISNGEQDLQDTKHEMQKLEEGNRFALMIADFAALMQSSSDLAVLAESVITELCTQLEASQGAFFIKFNDGSLNKLKLIAGYAYHIAESQDVVFEFGEGLAGQVAKEGKIFNFDSVPEGYVQILSGLGESTPKHLIILPLSNDEEVLGVIEIASFKAFNEGHVEFLNKLSSLFGAGLKRIMQEKSPSQSVAAAPAAAPVAQAPVQQVSPVQTPPATQMAPNQPTQVPPPNVDPNANLNPPQNPQV